MLKTGIHHKISVLLVMMVLVCGIGHANAIPFRVVGSDLEVKVNNTYYGALWNYTDYQMPIPIDLGEGQSFDFVFGKITIPYAATSNDIRLSVDLHTPDTPGDPIELGRAAVFSLFIIGIGHVEWGQPTTFNYSYGGLTGGIAQLDLHDAEEGYLSLTELVNFDITGTITNVVSPTPEPSLVPEPSSILLLCTGLFGLAGIGRKLLSK